MSEITQMVSDTECPVDSALFGLWVPDLINQPGT